MRIGDEVFREDVECRSRKMTKGRVTFEDLENDEAGVMARDMVRGKGLVVKTILETILVDDSTQDKVFMDKNGIHQGQTT